MNKKIKVIELLNKIANREEVPNKIKIFGIVFVWFEGSYRKEDANLEYITDYCRLDCMLNDEVEILEDNTEEIEGLKYELQNLFDDKGNILETQFILRDEDVIKTINDLVKTVNKMKEGKE